MCLLKGLLYTLNSPLNDYQQTLFDHDWDAQCVGCGEHEHGFALLSDPTHCNYAIITFIKNASVRSN